MKENPFSDLTALALRHEIVSTARFLPLRCFFSDDGISYVPPHFHEDLELIHLLSGELSVTVNQKKFTIYPGDTVLFNTNTIHSTLSERVDTTAHVLLLPYEHLRRCLPNPESFPFELPLLSRDEADPLLSSRCCLQALSGTAGFLSGADFKSHLRTDLSSLHHLPRFRKKCRPGKGISPL